MNLETQVNSLTKKPEGQKSHETVPLKTNFLWCIQECNIIYYFVMFLFKLKHDKYCGDLIW
jgi:hypothetical protein